MVRSKARSRTHISLVELKILFSSIFLVWLWASSRVWGDKAGPLCSNTVLHNLGRLQALLTRQPAVHSVPGVQVTSQRSFDPHDTSAECLLHLLSEWERGGLPPPSQGFYPQPVPSALQPLLSQWSVTDSWDCCELFQYCTFLESCFEIYQNLDNIPPVNVKNVNIACQKEKLCNKKEGGSLECVLVRRGRGKKHVELSFPCALKKSIRLPVPEFAVWGWSGALSALSSKQYRRVWKQQDALQDQFCISS